MCPYAGLGVNFGPLPPSLLKARYVFPINTLVKIAIWHVYQRHEAYIKGERKRRGDSHYGADEGVDFIFASPNQPIKKKITPRQAVTFYIAFSDIFLICLLSLLHFGLVKRADVDDRIIVRIHTFIIFSSIRSILLYLYVFHST